MASKRAIKSEKNRLVAKVIEEDSEGGPCAFCHRIVNDEASYGKLYSIGELYCHYFCVLLSCCLLQKGIDSEGLLGFLYTDIKAELERSKKHRCSYCGKGGANQGCTVAQCRKQFHVPCGQEKNAVSMFFGNYKSYCEKHAPQQKIDSKIMVKAQARRAEARKKARLKTAQNNLAHSGAAQNNMAHSGAEQNKESYGGVVNESAHNIEHNCSAPNIITKTVAEKTAQNIVLSGAQNGMAQDKMNTSNNDSILFDASYSNLSEEVNKIDTDDQSVDVDTLCVICYEEVSRWPSSTTFWPPCCARDAWFHRSCLQRMALSAGMHYLKCPLCNDKPQFYKAVVSQGYYVPDRDAAWELEQNAFAEIYERPLNCGAEQCKCPFGRKHDEENGEWDIQLCLLCGGSGAHRGCRADHCDGAGGTGTGAGGTGTGTGAGGTGTGAGGTGTGAGGTGAGGTGAGGTGAGGTGAGGTGTGAGGTGAGGTGTGAGGTGTGAGGTGAGGTGAGGTGTGAGGTGAGGTGTGAGARFVCALCSAAAKGDGWTQLEDALEAISQQEQAQTQASATLTGPLMPSRMSIRRTKSRIFNPNSIHENCHAKKEVEKSVSESNTESSRAELNLKSPRSIQNSRPSIQKVIQSHPIQTEVKQSPMKLLENELYEKIAGMDVVFDAKRLIDGLRLRLKKPQPLSVKKKIVNGILDEIFINNNNAREQNIKTKEPIKEFNSPSKVEKCSENIEKTKARPKEQHRKVLKQKIKSLSLKRCTKGKEKERKREKFHKKYEKFAVKSTETDLAKDVNIGEDLEENGDESKTNISEKVKIEKELNYITSVEKNVIKQNNELAVDDILVKQEVKDRNDEVTPKVDEVSSKNCEDCVNNDVVSMKTDKVSIKKEAHNFETDKIMPLIDTPKKSTTVDIEKDSSFEISENDESIKIDLVKIESCTSDVIKDINLSPDNKLCLKFNSDKEILDNVNVVDIESFKNQYLNEVERDKKTNKQEEEKCSFNHKHEKNTHSENNIKTAIDFAMDVPKKDGFNKKKKKIKNKNKKRSRKIKLVYFNKNEAKGKKKPKKKKKNSKNESDLSVEINWREEEVNIKIKNKVLKRKHSESNKRKNQNENRSNLKQTILKFSPEGSEKLFASPENDATPKKRKKIKQEKTQDSLKQMSIQSFFKVKSP